MFSINDKNGSNTYDKTIKDQVYLKLLVLLVGCVGMTNILN